MVNSLAVNKSKRVSHSTKNLLKPKLIEKDINDELYYHGFMSRAEAETMLRNLGDFFVRRIHENKINVKRFFSNLKYFFSDLCSFS